MKITIDHREENRNQNMVFENCEQDNALLNLDLLDGNKHTLLSFEREDGWYMHIGGGQRYFIVTIISPDGKSLTLINPNGRDEAVELCAGGQYAEFPQTIVVEKEQVIDVTRRFYKKRKGVDLGILADF